MGIKLSEHRSFKIYKATENIIESRYYLVSEVFALIKVEEQRKIFSKIEPYQLKHNFSENSFELQADYYIGIDWLVKGQKYVQVEPKINAKLLEIYHESLEREELSEEAYIEKEQQNKIRLDNAFEEKDNLKNLDYLKMLLEVYASPISTEQLGDLVEIYWQDPKIKIEQKDDYLTPFLIVQFLEILKKIVQKGLKKSYYKVQENLQNRVKGKVLVGQQIKKNILKNRFTSTYCEYQVFGVNNVENQFLKKVFKFCTHYIQNQPQFFVSTKTRLSHTINYIRPAFELIDDSIKESELRNYRHNPFFKEYKEATNIGNFILKQLGYNISVTSGKHIETPPFWIDMPKLFELYFYQKLLKDNPNDHQKIIFQLKTYGNALDFLIKDGENSIIIDTKYKLHYKQSHIHQDIRQVSGYARLKTVRNKCGLIATDTHINCLIVYPILNVDGYSNENFSIESIQNALTKNNEIKAYYKVYKLGLQLPII